MQPGSQRPISLDLSRGCCPVLYRVPKLVDSTMAELGVSGPPDIATRATCGAYLALRAEVIALQELKRRLANK